MAWDGGGGRKDEQGIREDYISTKGPILGFTGDLSIYGIPGPRRDPPDCSLDRGVGA